MGVRPVVSSWQRRLAASYVLQSPACPPERLCPRVLRVESAWRRQGRRGLYQRKGDGQSDQMEYVRQVRVKAPMVD